MFIQRVLRQCPKCPNIRTIRLARQLIMIPPRNVYYCPKCGEEWSFPDPSPPHQWEPEDE